MTNNEIKEIVAFIEESGFNRFRMSNGEFELELEKSLPASAAAPALQPALIPQPQAGLVAPAVSEAPAAEDNVHYVTSPIVGTFYHASSPDAQPFVRIGDRVKVGDTICLIEAMKLLNEIQSDVSGKVVSVEVNNANPVEFGSRLVGIVPD